MNRTWKQQALALHEHQVSIGAASVRRVDEGETEAERALREKLARDHYRAELLALREACEAELLETMETDAPPAALRPAWSDDLYREWRAVNLIWAWQRARLEAERGEGEGVDEAVPATPEKTLDHRTRGHE